MELTWLGHAEARGFEIATRQAVALLRRVVFRQIEQRFGAVPAEVRQKIEAMDDFESLAMLAEKVLVVSSMDELGLR